MNSPSDRQAALDYHQYPVPGKISVVASKPLVNQRDLALAYSPGWRRPVRKSWPTRPMCSATRRAAIWWA